MTSVKFLSYGMKGDNSDPDPDPPELGNKFLNSITTDSKKICKPFTRTFTESSAHIHWFFVCLLCLSIFNIVSIELMYGCM